MKKILIGLFLCLTFIICLGCLTACGDSSDNNVNQDIYDVYSKYVFSVQSNGGTPLSYEEWLTTIKGEKGEKGEKGKDGENGIGISNAEIDENGNLIIYLTDDTILNVGKVAEVHPHDIIEKEVIEREPTCTEVGLKYIYCEKCSNLLKTLIIEKLPHNYEDIITPPTCTENGYTTHTCKDCGHIEIDTYTEPNGHSYKTEFMLDDMYHWHETTCEHENSIVKEEHVLNNEGICLICGYDSNITLALTFDKISGKDEYAVTGISNDKVKTVFIPETYNDLPVTKITANAFKGNTSIESLIMSDNINEIGGGAFYECSSLTNIYLSNKINIINDYTFYGCKKLNKIVLPDTVERIGGYAFDSVGDGFTINIPNSLTIVDYYAFGGYYSSLRNIYINSVSQWIDIIRNNEYLRLCSDGFFNNLGVFINNEPLYDLTIPDDVEYIPSNTFKGWRIKTVTIPKSVKRFHDKAFYKCSNLQKVNYLGTIDEWCEISFYDSVYANPLFYAHELYINDILINELNITSATSIASYAFINCTNITKILMNNTVEGIGERAFEGCTSLTEIIIPQSVKIIGSRAFSGCNNLKKATFESLDGWHNYNTENIDVSDVYQNALYLTDKYVGRALYKN